MSDNKQYNGWTNYETWNVALWLGNDEGSSRYWEEQASECWDKAENYRAYEGQAKKQGATYLLANQLEAEVKEGNPISSDASMYSDLLSAALSDVSWYEIAMHYLDEFEEKEDFDAKSA